MDSTLLKGSIQLFMQPVLGSRVGRCLAMGAGSGFEFSARCGCLPLPALCSLAHPAATRRPWVRALPWWCAGVCPSCPPAVCSAVQADMAPQVVGPEPAQAVGVAIVGKNGLQIPKAPEDYRHLEDGYKAIEVADWAEQRVCVLTGSSCLYASRAFKAGEVMSEFGPKVVVDEPNYLTVQVGETQHIMLSPEWLQYINHSCDPNVAFDTSTFKLLALRDIQPGDELCFFYPSTEWEMAAPFQCRCGTKKCCGLIAGASQMDPVRLEQYRLTDFIAGKLSRNSSNASTP